MRRDTLAMRGNGGLLFSRQRHRARRALVLAAGSILCFTQSSQAQQVNSTWIGPDGGSWSDAANWSNGVPINGQPAGVTYNVFIDGSADNKTVIGNLSALLDNLTVDAGDTLALQNFVLLGLQGDNGTGTTGTLLNNGIISLNTTTNFCQFRVSLGSMNLNGIGQIILNNENFDRIQGTNATDRIINSATHTIRGTGRFGNDFTGIVNHGLVDADRTTSLTIDPTDTITMINTGTLRGSNSGGLVLQDGTFDNSLGLIEATAGGRVVVQDATLQGGNLATAGTGAIQLNALVTLDGTTLGAISNTGNVEILDLADVSLLGSMANDGMIQMLGSSGATLRVASASFTLGGTGALVMNSATADRVIGTASSNLLINDTGHTISGTGQIGADFMALTNRGVIDADRATALVIDPTDAQTVLNTGTLRGSNSGGLVLQDGTFDNSLGLIEATDGGLVAVQGSTIQGGDLSTAGTGVIQLSGLVTLDGVTVGAITNNGNVEILDMADVTGTGLIANNGNISMMGVGSTSTLRVGTASLTLGGTGALVLNSATGDRVIGTADTDLLINDTMHTISGTGQLGADFMAFTNRGLVDADRTTPLTLDPTDAQTVINEGTLRGSNSGGLILAGGIINNNTGLIEATDGGLVAVQGSTIQGGELSTAGTGVIQLSGAVTLDGATQGAITNGGNVEILDMADVTATGVITNNGNINMLGVGSTSTLRVGTASLTLGGSGALVMNSATGDRVIGTVDSDLLINDTTHTIRGTGQLGADFLALTNRGLVDADRATPLTVDPTDSQPVINEGTLRGSNSGGLVLTDGVFNNALGTIEATDGGLVVVQDATIQGGALNSAGTGVVQLSGAVALDGSVNQITSTANVQVLDLATAVGSGMIVNNAAITIDAGGMLEIATGATLSGNGVVANGNFNVNGAASIADVTGTGAATVGTGGVLTVNNVRVANLTINIDGLTTINTGGGTAGTSNVKTLVITDGRMNLADHDMVIDYDPTPDGGSPIVTIRGYLLSGYSAGAWNGVGINTSSGTASGFGIGYAEATDIFTTFPAMFSGQEVDASSLLMKFTRFGDADLSGTVNLDDFNRLAANFGLSDRFWFSGDFNYNGIVNLDDFNLLAGNFGLSAGPDGVVDPEDWAALASAVPEPATSASGLLFAMSLLSRRKRRERCCRQ